MEFCTGGRVVGDATLKLPVLVKLTERYKAYFVYLAIVCGLLNPHALNGAKQFISRLLYHQVRANLPDADLVQANHLLGGLSIPFVL